MAVDLIMKKETLLFLETYNKNPKECLNCGSPILFKPGDKLHKFKKRKFCSLKCSRENTSKNKKNHTCYSCGDKRDKNSELCRKCFNIINNPINEKTVELGWILNQDHWGKGLMPEAAECLLALSFDKLEVKVIQAKHFTENAKSGRVMEKLGMKHLGKVYSYFPKFKNPLLTDYWAITKDEYELLH